jgi:hypothetical protein
MYVVRKSTCICHARIRSSVLRVVFEHANSKSVHIPIGHAFAIILYTTARSRVRMSARWMPRDSRLAWGR